MDAVERAWLALRAGVFCKIISGVRQFDHRVVERLALLYAAADAHVLDVAADAGVVAAAVQGRDRAGKSDSCVVMVSLGLAGDPHVAAGAPQWDGDLGLVRACVEAGATAVELHATGEMPERIQYLCARLREVVAPRGLLSLSLGGADLPRLRRQIALAESLHPPPILQIEAVPMGGAKHGEPDAPSIALAQAVRGDIERCWLQIAGGAGTETRIRCQKVGLHIDGIGIGTAAHTAVRAALDAADLAAEDPAFAAARRLVAAATGEA
jgi:hypothetical protein